MVNGTPRIVFVILFLTSFVTLGGCGASTYAQEAADMKKLEMVLARAAQFRQTFKELQATAVRMHGDVELACAKFGEGSGMCAEMTRLWNLEIEQAALVDKTITAFEKTGRDIQDVVGALQVLRDIVVDFIKESGRVRSAVRLADGRPEPAPEVNANETVVTGPVVGPGV